MRKRSVLGMLLILPVLCSFLMLSFANSVEPPSVVIIVPQAPEDLQIALKSGDTLARSRKIHRILETYYTFYTYELNATEPYVLDISTGGARFEMPVSYPFKTYNNIKTLNLDTRTLTEGKLPMRDAILITLRVGTTLILEAAVFLLMGFRHKRTWLIFLGINLVTQGGLNIWLSGFAPLQSYAVFILIFGEFFVFLSEGAAFTLLVREKRRLRVLGTVLLANLVSLIAGGYLITLLPL